MKALSIRQPWAWLIAQGFKDIENRSRRTHFRGTIYLHAGITDDKEEWDTAMEMASFIIPDIYTRIPQDRLHHIRYGGIIGSVEIIDCVETHNSPWFTGPYGYVLANPKLLPFMPCRGKLGMFPVEYRSGLAGSPIPAEVAVCPECGGSLTLVEDFDSDGEDPPTMECENEPEIDSEESDPHRWWQSEWQPVIDKVSAFLRTNVTTEAHHG